MQKKKCLNASVGEAMDKTCNLNDSAHGDEFTPRDKMAMVTR